MQGIRHNGTEVVTDEEMERISQLDRNEKHDWY